MASKALRHLIAEQHFQRETAWAAVLYAAAALEERTDDAGLAAAVAKANGAAATKLVIEGALQVFGGVGFTREHDLHLLYRRALECAGRFGGPLEHERRSPTRCCPGRREEGAKERWRAAGRGGGRGGGKEGGRCSPFG